MSQLDIVLQKLRGGDSEDDVLGFLDTLSWNEIRAMKGEATAWLDKAGPAWHMPSFFLCAFFVGFSFFFFWRAVTRQLWNLA